MVWVEQGLYYQAVGEGCRRYCHVVGGGGGSSPLDWAFLLSDVVFLASCCILFVVLSLVFCRLGLRPGSLPRLGSSRLFLGVSDSAFISVVRSSVRPGFCAFGEFLCLFVLLLPRGRSAPSRVCL